jgi:hypothetical protein
MKILINKNHIFCHGMTFEVAQRLSDRIITTDNNFFFLDQFEPVFDNLAKEILDLLSGNSDLPYHAAWDICEKLGLDAEFVYSERWESAIASLLFWEKIKEIPGVKYRYRLARSSVVEARVGDRT